jgi:hypothetical protein
MKLSKVRICFDDPAEERMNSWYYRGYRMQMNSQLMFIARINAGIVSIYWRSKKEWY